MFTKMRALAEKWKSWAGPPSPTVPKNKMQLNVPIIIGYKKLNLYRFLYIFNPYSPLLKVNKVFILDLNIFFYQV